MTDGRLDVEVLVRTIDARRKAGNISWREVARKAGVSPSTLTRMQQGKRPDVDTFGALVRWLNVPADNFLTLGKLCKKQLHPVSAISTLLRGKKELSPEAVEALD